MTVRNSNRKIVDIPYLGREPGNLGMLAVEREAKRAAKSSKTFLKLVQRSSLMLERPRQERPRSFEEQLALVECGRARIVDSPRVPVAEHDFTLGGVSDWAALG